MSSRVLSALALLLIAVAATIIVLRATTIGTLVLAPDATLPDGSEYFGDLREHKFHGQGRLMWPNGARYEGGFSNGLFSGFGRLRHADGSYYKGEFVEGLSSGHGRMTFADGSAYEGSFDQGLFNGEGSYRYARGDRYTGSFVDGRRQGHGSYRHRSGYVYEGEFEHGEFAGSGIFISADGNRYEGEFDADWQFHGKGTYKTAGGDEYSGDFVAGSFTGAGTHKRQDGQFYEGQFADWYFDGKGRLLGSNGDAYVGEFSGGYYHGTGTLTLAEPGDGPRTRSGQWEFGEFAGEATLASKLVEDALHNHSTLLDSALAAIAPNDPERVDLYFVGIAGYGRQDVFMKEVSFVKNQFDGQLGTQSRSLLLVNNATTVDEVPMATVRSIEYALTRVSEKMDPDNDILFVYLTSHGSRDHQFAMRQRGFDLSDLSAEQLGGIVRGLPVKWKVIAVAACFSGGFLPELENEHTLVMTAASATRESFGCSDDADMTYFGRAFFEHSVPAADSFSAAFDNAVNLIDEWEREQDFAHSRPQISRPPAILAQLGRWREELSRTTP